MQPGGVWCGGGCFRGRYRFQQGFRSHVRVLTYIPVLTVTGALDFFRGSLLSRTGDASVSPSNSWDTISVEYTSISKEVDEFVYTHQVRTGRGFEVVLLLLLLFSDSKQTHCGMRTSVLSPPCYGFADLEMHNVLSYSSTVVSCMAYYFD